MIARIGLASVNPADLTITSDLFRRDWLNALRSASGCLDVFLLVNREQGVVIIVSLWERDEKWRDFTSINRSLPFGLSADMFSSYEVARSAGSYSGAAARVHRANVVPEHVPDVVHVFENVVMHAATAQHGFQGIVLVVNRERGFGLSISVWDSAADMHASEESGYLDDQLSRFAAYLTEPPTAEEYDVLRAG